MKIHNLSIRQFVLGFNMNYRALIPWLLQKILNM